MAMEKEALTHKIEDDLAARNRNWDKLTSHLAESASKHIKESGTNANGSYIKFDDGTMICYREVQVETVSGQNKLTASNIPLPAAFPDNKYNIIASISGTPFGLYLATTSYPVSNSTFNIASQAISGTFAGISTQKFHVIAIGRWKA